MANVTILPVFSLQEPRHLNRDPVFLLFPWLNVKAGHSAYSTTASEEPRRDVPFAIKVNI